MKKIGLIIGRFDPIHLGHINIVKFGAEKCDILNILVCATSEEENFDSETRYNWVKELLKGYTNINIKLFSKIMPTSENSSNDVSKIWAEHIKSEYPDVNIIISSENYGQYLADYMSNDIKKVEHLEYDFDRKLVPISSTKIMNDPIKYWNFIPDIVKPYLRKDKTN